MTALLAYQFEEEPVRVVMIAGEPWFVANDICKVLALSNPRKAVGDLDEDERGVTTSDTLGGQQEMNVISESGLYSLIFRSRKAEAKRFRKWVTAEVLPTIRKTGRYELAGHEPPQLEIAPDLDAAKVAAGVALVREARRLFGANGARDVWMQIGLPQPIVDAVGNMDGDAIVAPIKALLANRTETTRIEITRAVGLDPDSFRDLRRVSTAMALCGWRSRPVRRDGILVKRWFPLSVLEG